MTDILSEGICDDDIDGNPRPGGAARDIGADELFGTVKKQNVTLPLMLLLG